MKKKIALIGLFLVVSFIGAGLVYGYNTLFKINEMISEPKLEEANLDINHDLDIETVNIAVFGIDGRSDVDGDRSDTIMVVSLDFRNGNVRVSSIMRDLLVYIPESKKNNESYDKINAAYSYGGPELAVKTLNQNFDLNISDYVIVNFDCMVDTVDALGGVEINIKSESILEWTNKYIDDVNEKVEKADPKLEETGPQLVTGVQALAYSRNRYSDDDFHRTERQREVVRGIVEKAFAIDIKSGLNLLSKVYPYVQTTLSLNEITTYAKAFLGSTDKAFYEFRIPTDNHVITTMINGISYVVPDTLYDNVIALHDFIYGPIIPKDSLVRENEMTEESDQLTGESQANPGATSSNRVSPDLNDQAGSDPSRSSSTSSSAYKSYLPSAKVKKLSEAIRNFAINGYSSDWSDDSEDSWTSEPVYEEPFYEEPLYEEPLYEEPIDEEPVDEEDGNSHEPDVTTNDSSPMIEYNE